jgi:hypothetical protein
MLEGGNARARRLTQIIAVYRRPFAVAIGLPSIELRLMMKDRRQIAFGLHIVPRGRQWGRYHGGP